MNRQDGKSLGPERSAIWAPVWNDRDDDQADWNGFEACFDSVGAYERWVEDASALLIERLELGHLDVVGDLGCGTGRIAACIAPHVRTVHAFDYSDTVLRVAKKRRSRLNITYNRADLNDFHPVGWGLTKAFSLGALLYMDNEVRVFDLIRELNNQHIDFAALDLPDDQLVDNRPRTYDTLIYNHLRLNEKRLLREFPTGYVKRGEFHDYVNGRTRFNFYLPAPKTPQALDTGLASI